MPFLPFLIITGILVFLAVLVSFITFRITFYHNRRWHTDPFVGLERESFKAYADKSRELIEGIIATPYEKVEIRARDGTRLVGRYYHVRDGAPLNIMLHGYKSTPMRDFSGGAAEAFELGHNVLLADQRAHSGSGGRVITFGLKERFDCLDWIDYAVSRFGETVEITLVGISMGAATVLYASELGLPRSVKGIIADCPYSSPELIIKKVAKEMGFPPRAVFPFIRLGGMIFGGFDVCRRTPLEAVKNANIPILLIHGDGDSFVPCEMSRELYVACSSKKRLEVYAEAGHGLSYIVAPERYRAMLADFYGEILSETETKQ